MRILKGWVLGKPTKFTRANFEFNGWVNERSLLKPKCEIKRGHSKDN